MNSINIDLKKEIDEFPLELKGIAIEILEFLSKGASEENIRSMIDRNVSKLTDRE